MRIKEQRLKTSKSGLRTLYVYYAGNGYDEAIKQAERLYYVQNDMTVTVIALPESDPVSPISAGAGGCWENNNQIERRAKWELV